MAPKITHDIKNHRWLSSPYWPAKNLWQYTCSECGAAVIGKGSPHIKDKIVLTMKNGQLVDSGYTTRCEPYDWSPTWPPQKRKNK